PWDYFMLVEMGPDRLHHVFWHRFDPQHPKYEPGNKFETAFRDYYRFLDREVGELLEALPDDCITILMSDHGARRMVGGVCFNDWLAKEGYLTLSEPVSEGTPSGGAWGRWGPGPSPACSPTRTTPVPTARTTTAPACSPWSERRGSRAARSKASGSSTSAPPSCRSTDWRRPRAQPEGASCR